MQVDDSPLRKMSSVLAFLNRPLRIEAATVQGTTQNEVKEALLRVERELEEMIRLAEIYGADASLLRSLKEALKETKRLLSSSN